MDKLIQALQIFLKYGNPKFPTHCEHDILMVMIEEEISEEDKEKLEELHFNWNDEYGCWASYYFGSA